MMIAYFFESDDDDDDDDDDGGGGEVVWNREVHSHFLPDKLLLTFFPKQTKNISEVPNEVLSLPPLEGE